MIVFLLAIKWRWLTRLALFIELTVYMSESLLPLDVSELEFHSHAKLLAVILHFILSLFNWWPSLVYSIVAIFVWHYNRSLLYGGSLDDVVKFAFLKAVWLGIMVLFVHMIITSVGMLFAETEV